jgi:hypothetical protein
MKKFMWMASGFGLQAVGCVPAVSAAVLVVNQTGKTVEVRGAQPPMLENNGVRLVERDFAIGKWNVRRDGKCIVATMQGTGTTHKACEIATATETYPKEWQACAVVRVLPDGIRVALASPEYCVESAAQDNLTGGWVKPIRQRLMRQLEYLDWH